MKLDSLPRFYKLVFILKWHYNIKVYIPYIDFSKFYSNITTNYINQTWITLEFSATNTQQQNKVVERYIYTVVKGAKA